MTEKNVKQISIVMPTYNYGRFIAEALESALAQTRPASEVIVVDDGSTDDTYDVTSRFGNAVRYIQQKNAGVSAARNRGVMESRGDLIAFMDADDIWEKTKLEKQAALFDLDAEIGLVHCGMRKFDSTTGETIELLTRGLAGAVADELLLWERPAVNVSGSSVMVSRQAFDAVHGFDTLIKCGEDWDFCYRVARRFKVGFVADPLVNYRDHHSAAHRDVSEMERGMGRFYEKAFAENDEHLRQIRSRAMANFRKVLAGSYYNAGDYPRFIRSAAICILNRPSSLGYFLQYPIRRYRRKP